ncbi:MBL fold metallo-hydrolase [Labrys sp. La1]|uniref:MBL fold metallo-hydrolase n=1 Tax=Labrys sp. La1 TaxID=3404917 RepID=UPI003EB9DD99
MTVVPPTAWFARESLTPDLTRLWEPCVHAFFQANIFHLRGRDADLVLDFGMGLSSLRGALELTEGKPVLAVASHGHVDHVGSFHEFEQRFGHVAEQAAFAEMRDDDTLASLFRDMDGAVTRPPVPSWQAADYRLDPTPLTACLAEGDTIDLGNVRLRVLHLPGHSPGSIGLLDEQGGLFFSGDAIYRGGLVDDVPGADKIVYRRTMERLARLDIAVAHGGHGDSMDRAAMQAIALDYLRD